MSNKLKKALSFMLVLVTFLCLAAIVSKTDAATALSKSVAQNLLHIRVTGSQVTKTYTGAMQYYTGKVTASCSDPGFNPSKFSYTGAKNVSGLTVGSYTRTLYKSYCKYDDSNYMVEWEIVNPIKMTINPKALTITVSGNSTTKTYTGVTQSFTGTVTATCSDSFFDASKFLYSGTKKVSGKNANIYTAAIDKSKCSYSDPNCNITWKTGNPIKMTINPKPITITVHGTTGAKPYTGSQVSYTGSAYAVCSDSGFNDNLFSYDGNKVVTGTSVDTYTKAIDTTKCFYNDPNYTVTWKKGNPIKLIIKPQLFVKIDGNSVTKTYTGYMQGFTGTVTPTCTSSKPSGYVSKFDASKFSYSGERYVSGKLVGNYTKQLNASSCSYNDDNYFVNFTVGDPIKMTIAPRAITITVHGTTGVKPYTGSQVSYTGSAYAVCSDIDLNENLFSYDGNKVVTGTSVGTHTKAIDTTKCFYNDPNYNVTFKAGNPITLIIKPQLIVRIDGNSVTKAYTGHMQSFTGTVTPTCTSSKPSGYVSSFDASKFSYSGERSVSGKLYGNYTINLDASSCSYNDDEYIVNFTIGNPIKMTIAAREITITVHGTSSEEKEYNGSTQTYEGSVYAVCSDSDFNADLFSYDGTTTVKGTKVGTYTAEIDTSKCHYIDPNLAVTFVKGNPIKMTITPINDGRPFQDVAPGEYYYDAIRWAKNNGIANGTSEYYFSPDAEVTRAQAVCFIWRVMGSPEPRSTVNPYSDVSSDRWYYKPALWAYYNVPQVLLDTTENNSGAIAFGPNNKCTRGQAITLLWKANGEPDPWTSDNPFEDINGNSFYYKAVLWAYNRDPRVAGGTYDFYFSPNEMVTRAQMMVFLYNLTNKGDAFPWYPENPQYSETDETNPVDWPELSEDAYCEFYAPSGVPMYKYAGLNGPSFGYLPVDIPCRAYELTSERITVSYEDPVTQNTVRVYVKRKDLIKADTPYEYLLNGWENGWVFNAYKTLNGGYYIEIDDGSIVYGLPSADNDSDYVQVIFQDNVSSRPKLAYRLGWITKTDYETIKFPDALEPGNPDDIYINSIDGLVRGVIGTDYIVETIGQSFDTFDFESTPRWTPRQDKVTYSNKIYYKFPMPDGHNICIETSLFRRENDACYPDLSVWSTAAAEGYCANQRQYYVYTIEHDAWQEQETSEYTESEGYPLYWVKEYWTYFITLQHDIKLYGGDTVYLFTRLVNIDKLVTRSKCKLEDIENEVYHDYLWTAETGAAKGEVLNLSYTAEVNKIGYLDDPGTYYSLQDIPSLIGLKKINDDEYDTIIEGENNIPLSELNDHFYFDSFACFTTEADPSEKSTSFKDYVDTGVAVWDTTKEIWTFVNETAENMVEEGLYGGLIKTGLKLAKKVWDNIEKVKKLNQTGAVPTNEGNKTATFYEDTNVSINDTATYPNGGSKSAYCYKYKVDHPINLVTVGSYVGVKLHFNRPGISDGRATFGIPRAIISFDWEKYPRD